MKSKFFGIAGMVISLQVVSIIRACVICLRLSCCTDWLSRDQYALPLIRLIGDFVETAFKQYDLDLICRQRPVPHLLLGCRVSGLAALDNEQILRCDYGRPIVPLPEIEGDELAAVLVFVDEPWD